MGHTSSTTVTPASASRLPKVQDCFKLSAMEHQRTMDALFAAGTHHLLQDKFPMPGDTIGLVLRYCSIKDIIRLMAICRSVYNYLPVLWRDIASARCHPKTMEELDRRAQDVAEYRTVAQYGTPFFFTADGPNQAMTGYVTHSLGGKEVSSTRISLKDVVLLMDRPIHTSGISCLSVRFSPVSLKSRMPSFASRKHFPPLRAAVGFTQLHEGQLLKPHFSRFHSLASYFSMDGVFRKAGALQPKQRTWTYGDDVTMVVNYPEHSCVFYVNGERIIKMWGLQFDPRHPIWFFVRFGSSTTYRCQIL